LEFQYLKGRHYILIHRQAATAKLDFDATVFFIAFFKVDKNLFFVAMCVVLWFLLFTGIASVSTGRSKLQEITKSD
jgi:hypothetical protein